MTDGPSHDRPDDTGDGQDTNSALLEEVRRRAGRTRRWMREGDPTLTRQLAAVGVLGWIIVVPALLGVVLGRWLDQWLGSGIMFTAALLMLGVLLGSWSAWRWMHDR
jgi:ATP synthase protein I